MTLEEMNSFFVKVTSFYQACGKRVKLIQVKEKELQIERESLNAKEVEVNNQIEVLNKLKKEVDASQATLDEKQSAWKLVMERLESNAAAASDLVKFDVRGHKSFVTTKSNLLKHPGSFFDALLTSGRFFPNDEGFHFIDRYWSLLCIE